MTQLSDALKKYDVNEIPLETITPIVSLSQYHEEHPETKPLAFVISVIEKLGFDSQKEVLQPQSVMIETWHPYILETDPKEIISITNQLGYSFSHANRFKEILSILGATTDIGLFIDDVHIGRGISEILAAQETNVLGAKFITHLFKNGLTEKSVLVKNTGEAFDKIAFESDMREHGLNLIEKILAIPNLKTNTPESNRRRIKTENGDIYFYEKDKDGKDIKTQPSCEFMDLAWQLLLEEKYFAGIILLPETYKSQQERVLYLKNLLKPNTKEFKVITILLPN